MTKKKTVKLPPKPKRGKLESTQDLDSGQGQANTNSTDAPILIDEDLGDFGYDDDTPGVDAQEPVDMDALRNDVDTWIEAKKDTPWSENAFHDFCEELLKAGGINTTRDYLVTMVVKTWPDVGLKAGTLSGAWKTTEEAMYGQGRVR